MLRCLLLLASAGIEPSATELKVRYLNHLTTRPHLHYFIYQLIYINIGWFGPIYYMEVAASIKKHTSILLHRCQIGCPIFSYSVKHFVYISSIFAVELFM